MRGCLYVLALVGALVGCDDEPAPVEPTPEPVAPQTGEPDAPRPPRGAAPADCAEGSDDPPELATLSAMADDGALDGAIEGLEALVGAHPASATARVRLGQLLLRAGPERVEAARRWFDRALVLHGEGCALAERDLWAAHEGAALSRMMAGDYAGARPWLERSLARWSTARSTHYNLACARCQTGDLAGCGESLEAVFAPGPEPELFEGQQHPVAHYRDLARRDPDLAPLRADGERFEAIVREP